MFFRVRKALFPVGKIEIRLFFRRERPSNFGPLNLLPRHVSAQVPLPPYKPAMKIAPLVLSMAESVEAVQI